ncbi:hypothetical protein EUGRSUZ_B01859 [Eucalyptus grandis]|uniref:Uncharacterized protein n=2 Tax=Eucalyptus grandis TaxID=71139 RepID=A0ACC3LRI3_EUCGR|nr:hypothetical protein EUGRSUZ_B01859 [Eucalyptus grandis]
MGCCGDDDDDDREPPPRTPDLSPPSSSSSSASSASAADDSTISPMNSHFSALACRDTLRLIFEKLPVPDLARASCVCRIWSSVASDRDMVTRAFAVPWRLKEVVGVPSSGGFWRDKGVGKFAISHRIKRGDSVASLAVKYSVQVMEFLSRLLY